LTWHDLSVGLPNGAGAAAMAFSPDGPYLYVSRYAGSVYRVRLDSKKTTGEES
jgi:sugar lactone lactonase YvrE